MAKVTETTVTVPAPPRTFTVEGLSFDQLVALAEWSYTTEASHGSLYARCSYEVQLTAKENLNRRIAARTPRLNWDSTGRAF